MKTSHSSAIGLLTILLAACTANSQDLLEDVTEGTSSASSEAHASPVISERVLPGGILEIGNASAPLSMSLTINHDSPYSRQFHSTHMPMLEKEYISKGLLKMSIFATSFDKYPDSLEHARKLMCATKQGKGFAMHNLLMSGSKTLLPANIDRPAFETCLTADETNADLIAQAEGNMGEDLHVVPLYYINGARFTGVPTWADLRGALNATR